LAEYFESSAYLLINQCLGRAELNTGRFSLTNVTFYNFVVNIIHKAASEWAGRNTGHAFDTPFFVQIDSPGLFITLESIKQTGFGTGRIIALQTDDRHIFIFGIGDRVNPAAARFFILRMSERTGQLAGAAADTERGDYFITEHHKATSFAASTRPPIFRASSKRLQSSQVSKYSGGSSRFSTR